MLQCVHDDRSVGLELWLPVESLSTAVTISGPARRLGGVRTLEKRRRKDREMEKGSQTRQEVN